MKANTQVWISLLLLSVASFAVSGIPRGTASGVIVLGSAGVKASMVGWQCMELRAAHQVWKLGLLFLLFGMLSLIGVLSRIA